MPVGLLFGAFVTVFSVLVFLACIWHKKGILFTMATTHGTMTVLDATSRAPLTDTLVASLLVCSVITICVVVACHLWQQNNTHDYSPMPARKPETHPSPSSLSRKEIPMQEHEPRRLKSPRDTRNLPTGARPTIGRINPAELGELQQRARRPPNIGTDDTGRFQPQGGLGQQQLHTSAATAVTRELPTTEELLRASEDPRALAEFQKRYGSAIFSRR